jgi:FixJ family two-component response regulator
MPHVRKLVAVIDDDAFVRRALDRQLRAAGFRCEVFPSAESFLDIAMELRADCLVSDINLGGMSGLELALHPTVVNLKLPVVLITSQHDPVLEEPAQVVASAFLHKPIPPGKLLEAIVDTVGPPLVERD